MDNEHGPVYEITGYARLAASDRVKLAEGLTAFFRPHGAVAWNLTDDHRLGVFVDRNAEYPDLYLEAEPERLFVCDMDVHGGHLLALLKHYLATQPGLALMHVRAVAGGGATQT